MATIFLEPGGDATFDTSLWPAVQSGPSVATDFVHGSHARSIKYATGVASTVIGSNFTADAGGRTSWWIYLNALPSVANANILRLAQTADGTSLVKIQLTTGGVVQLFETTAQLGSNGPTLTTGKWYRISFAWTITSTTVNQFRIWVNGTLAVTASNATITNVTSKDLEYGNSSANAALDMRSSDHYVDNSNALTDPGNIWVTAKRPWANGSSNQFTTQVGSGGSGYGSGHAQQVNERALSTTNGWSVSSAAKVTEEYTIEPINQGDYDLTFSTIVDYMGWMAANLASTADTPVDHIIVNNVATAKTLTVSNATYFAIAGSTTYPAGNTDIGMDAQYTTNPHLITLSECGLVFAFIPGTPPPPPLKITNKKVGPMALRRNFRQPYYPEVTPRAALSTLQDDFEFDDSVDTFKWSNNGGSQVTVTDDSNNHWLNLSSSLGGNYVGIFSNTAYTLYGSSMFSKLLSAGNQSITSWEVYPVLITNFSNGNNSVTIRITGGNVQAAQNTGSGLTMVGSPVTYNSTTMQWFRIRESGGTTFWEYSADCVSWTQLFSASNPIPYDYVQGAVEIGTWQAESSTTTAQIDNINVTPGGLQLNWAGYVWNKRIKQGSGINNQVLASNVGTPDANGYLTISSDTSLGSPAGAEIYTQKKSFGYGTYIVVVGSEVDNIYAALVVGALFLFDFAAPPAYNEIDIAEIKSYLGVAGQLLYNHTWNNGGTNTFITDSATENSGAILTHRLIWDSSGLQFDSFIGAGLTGTNYFSAYQSTHLPTPDAERVHISLTIQNDPTLNPYNTPATSVTLRSFTFSPNQPTYITPRLPNRGVGPMALRRKVRPYYPTAAVAVVNNNQTAIPSTATLTITTFAPTVLTPRVVIPSTATLTLTTFRPIIAQILIPSTKALTISTFRPVIARIVIPSTKALTITTYAPTVLAPRVCIPPKASLITTGFRPIIALAVIPTTKALTLTAYAPIIQPRPGTAALTLTTFAPTIKLGKIATPPTKALVLTTYAPTVLTPRVVIPGILALAITKYAPVIAKAVIPSTRALTLTTFAPVVLVPRVAIPGKLSLTLTTFAPAAQAPRTVIPSTKALTITSYAPTVAAGTTLIVLPSGVSLTITFYAPDVHVPPPTTFKRMNDHFPTNVSSRYLRRNTPGWN